jgi:putative transposase
MNSGNNEMALCVSERRAETGRRHSAMPRIARVVCPGLPHHITQRGVRRFNVFLDESDHRRYLELLQLHSPGFGLGIVAYCLMTNHVHILGIPERADSIAAVFKYCHGLYAAEFNRKYGKTGHVWQARPYSCVLDEPHTITAIRYIERNPVRAGMVVRAEDYPWSSASAHCGFETEALARPTGLTMPEVQDWSSWLAGEGDPNEEKRIRARTFTGRPCGNDVFIRKVEIIVGRSLAPGKPGPKPKRAIGEADPLPPILES